MATELKDVKPKTRPAGVNDNFVLTGLDINNVFENNKIVLKADNKIKVEELSTELMEGMTIKAYDGGKQHKEVSVEK